MPMGNKPKKQYEEESLSRILDYRTEMSTIIENIKIIDVFRSIDVDLPDNFLSNL
jgi:hypothetical protein